MTTVVEVLAQVQIELKAPKGQYNSFGKYHYRSTEDILEELKPILAKHNASVVLSDEMKLIGDRYYVVATATFYHGEATISNSAAARESLTKKGMDDSQITGTASSYARKYALNGLFLIDDTKDADTDEYHNQTNQTSNRGSQSKAQPQRITAELAETYKNAIIAIADSQGSNQGDVTKWFLEKLGVADYKQITVEQTQIADGLIARLKEKKKND